jgi:hypothetical protein
VRVKEAKERRDGKRAKVSECGQTKNLFHPVIAPYDLV